MVSMRLFLDCSLACARLVTPCGTQTHFLGVAFMTLAFGPRLAFLGLCCALGALCFNDLADWRNFPLNATLGAFLPVSVASGLFFLISRFLPKNPFIYSALPAPPHAAPCLCLFPPFVP